ncbi:MAG: hypothetical protein HKN26_12605, partial [Acidimicrobiales bacterium]|nr:hypothetical protein [Acidimicrobiales bacterium]
MPLPKKDRLAEYVAKAAEAVQREVNSAPEHRQAAQLARSVAARLDDPQGAPALPALGRRVLMLSPRDWAYHSTVDGVIASALRLRGADVAFVTCGGGLEVCDRANVTEAPPMPCRTCTKYVDNTADAFGFERFPIRAGWAGVDDGEWPELDTLSSSELVDVTYDGIPVGRLMQIPSKWFLLASRSDWDPLSPQMTRRF